ncbi:MAG: enoyl-CoA hydratase-related protein [Ilumatobacteraceae bacterium]
MTTPSGGAPTVRTVVDHHVLTVTIDRTDRGNAADRPTTEALAAVFRDLVDAADARAVVLRGEGRNLCTGADLTSVNARDGRPRTGHLVRELTASFHAAIQAVFDCPLPVVVAVKGRAAGFGVHLALAADFAVAARSATFHEPFTERGFNVDSGGSWLLPRRVGMQRAKQMLYLAEVVDAPTALAWGLVDDVVDDDALDGATRALAERLASRPSVGLANTKRLLHDHLDGTLQRAMHDEALAVELAVRSDDFKEGMRAFVERRPPEFTGR